jgi:hypothetical protein
MFFHFSAIFSVQFLVVLQTDFSAIFQYLKLEVNLLRNSFNKSSACSRVRWAVIVIGPSKEFVFFGAKPIF